MSSSNNTGEVTPTYASFLADGHDWCIDRFLCVLNDYEDHPAGWYDIGVVSTQLGARLCEDEDPDRLGMHLMPIAALFAGDHLCLDYRYVTSDPALVVWLHEDSDDFAPVTRPVTETFTEFLELLHYNSPPE